MAMRQWSSPRMPLTLQGEEDKSRALVRQARVYAGYLIDQLRGNQTYRTQTWTNLDGSSIQVFAWKDILGERALVRIYTSSEAKTQPTPVYYTFMFSGYYSKMYVDQVVQKIYVPGWIQSFYSTVKDPPYIGKLTTKIPTGYKWDAQPDMSAGYYAPEPNATEPTLLKNPIPDEACPPSGSARQLYQALLGANRSILDLVPDSWTDTQLFQLGLSIFEDNYFLTKTARDGMRAVRLTKNAFTRYLETKALTITDDTEKIVAQAYILSTLTLSPGTQEQILVSEEDMDAIYSEVGFDDYFNPGTSAPGGWAWNPEGSEALIALHRRRLMSSAGEHDYFEFDWKLLKAQLTFDNVNKTISATIDLVDSGIWDGMGVSFEGRSLITSQSAAYLYYKPRGDVAVVRAWYTMDGDQVLVKTGGSVFGSASIGLLNAAQITGYGADSAQISSTSTAYSSSAYVPGFCSYNPTWTPAIYDMGWSYSASFDSQHYNAQYNLTYEDAAVLYDGNYGNTFVWGHDYYVSEEEMWVPISYIQQDPKNVFVPEAQVPLLTVVILGEDIESVWLAARTPAVRSSQAVRHWDYICQAFTVSQRPWYLSLEEFNIQYSQQGAVWVRRGFYGMDTEPYTETVTITNETQEQFLGSTFIGRKGVDTNISSAATSSNYKYIFGFYITNTGRIAQPYRIRQSAQGDIRYYDNHIVGNNLPSDVANLVAIGAA